MNETEKLEIKDLLKEALEERSLEYKKKQKFYIRKRDFIDFFRNKISLIMLPILFVIISVLTYFVNLEKESKIVIREIEVERIVKIKNENLIFSDLNKEIQDNYVNEILYSSLLEKYNVLKDIKVNESTNTLVLNKKIVYLQASLKKTKKKLAKGKYISVSCYDSKIAIKSLSSTCKKKVNSFLKKFRKNQDFLSKISKKFFDIFFSKNLINKLFDTK
ncbi:MAG: hypothetical protein HRT40_08925 [Campylobacteraceae bacterium]|nr:hypothetical protein [Campylobacteraceae bacterium]